MINKFDVSQGKSLTLKTHGSGLRDTLYKTDSIMEQFDKTTINNILFLPPFLPVVSDHVGSLKIGLHSPPP